MACKEVSQPTTIQFMPKFFLVVCVFAVLNGCTNLFFYPSPEHVLKPDRLGLSYEDVFFRDGEGYQTHGWFLPAQGRRKGTILFLHGNAQNISTHIGAVYWLPRAGYAVFLLDYRGYGQSAGTPSVEGALDGIENALRLLVQNPHYSDGRVIVFAQSLGGALGIYASAHSAYRSHIQAVITESAFSGYRSIAREKLAESWITWLFHWPLSFLVTAEFSPQKAIGLMQPIPVLTIHGENDDVVSLRHAFILHQAAQPPKELWVIPEGRHIDAAKSEAFRQRFLGYLEKVARPVPQ